MLSSRLLAAVMTMAPMALAGGPHHVPGHFPTIQAAINAAQPGETVIVAPGTYTGPGNRDLDFGGKDIVVTSFGGSAVTVIDCQASSLDPHRGILFENGETRAAVLRGFTIKNAATLEGAIADQFNGGAVRIRNGASPTIIDCNFEQNTAGCWGGGVYVGFGGNPLIIGCMFRNNTADDGGGFFTWQGSTTEIRSSVFHGNVAGNAGGAIAEFGGGIMHISNCTIVQNVAAHWSIGGVIDFGNESTIHNSILWGNSGNEQIQNSQTTLSFCNVQGGAAGETNMDSDPSFAPDGYHLRANSPCFNAGGEYAPMPGEMDVDGERRIMNGRVDIGADEAVVDFPNLRELLRNLRRGRHGG